MLAALYLVKTEFDDNWPFLYCTGTFSLFAVRVMLKEIMDIPVFMTLIVYVL